METVNTRIVNLMDRLAHTSTTDQDILQTVYGLRRVVKGEMPSVLLCFGMPTTSSQLANLRQTVKTLTTKLQTQEAEVETLKATIIVLTDQLARAVSVRTRQPGDDYLYVEVMEIIRNKFGKQNGALTLWADYSAKCHAADPSVPMLTVSRLQVWRQAGSYPAWAVDQLLAMPVTSRTMHRWSADDIEFLCRLHLADRNKSDEALAAECSKHFGCEINANSIKSKFNILRKSGRIPVLRPKTNS